MSCFCDVAHHVQLRTAKGLLIKIKIAYSRSTAPAAFMLVIVENIRKYRSILWLLCVFCFENSQNVGCVFFSGFFIDFSNTFSLIFPIFFSSSSSTTTTTTSKSTTITTTTTTTT